MTLMMSVLAERGAVSTVSTMVWSCLQPGGRKQKRGRAEARSAHHTQHLEGLAGLQGTPPPTLLHTKREKQQSQGCKLHLPFPRIGLYPEGEKKNKNQSE